MIKNDRWIIEQAKKGMITPFEESLVRKNEGYPVISYGVSSYGYDLRLSPKEFKIFRHIPGKIIDPKQFNSDNLVDADLHLDNTGNYFVIPGHSYGLGVALEKLEMPSNVTAICVGKSTYARTALIVNVTPAEAGWKGHLVVEINNASPADVKIYANEGVCKLIFFEGEACQITYSDRQGIYQDQQEKIELAKV